MDMAKVDHFSEFSNRPYFHQDVSFGVRVVKLDSGAQFTMPNVIRTVTKSTLISEYHKHCKESQFEPLSNSTLFRILDARAASQRKSLQGLDNIAADGAAAFDLILKRLWTKLRKLRWRHNGHLQLEEGSGKVKPI